MKRFQSVVCALALTISLSSTVLAGNIHTVSASGNIHTKSAPSYTSAGFLTWGDITGVIVSIFGNIHV